MHIFCLGFGGALQEWYQRSGKKHRVSACVRSSEKCISLQSGGINAFVWDVHEGLSADGYRAVCEAEVIVVSAPPIVVQNFGDPHFPKVSTYLQNSNKNPTIVYLSSTNVYGNTDGAWVEENAVLNPSSARGEARIKAEEQWQSLEAKTHIFRLAGIYGFGRNQIRKLTSGKARCLIKAGHVFNRIHEWDIAEAIEQAIHQPKAGIYNLADDLPAPPQDVLRYASQISGYPLPQAEVYDDTLLSGLAREFYKDNKRIKNNRLRSWLGKPLLFPDYISGLDFIWQMQEK